VFARPHHFREEFRVLVVARGDPAVAAEKVPTTAAS